VLAVAVDVVSAWIGDHIKTALTAALVMVHSDGLILIFFNFKAD
jgi:hypothetical protein